MKNHMEKAEIIHLKLRGWSDARISRTYGCSRNTVHKYWLEYKKNLDQLTALDPTVDTRKVIESIVSPPTYDSSNRTSRKYSEEIDVELRRILKDEEMKKERLGGWTKQALTNVQIHQLLVDRGFDIGRTTISEKIREIRDETKEAYIEQIYDYGERFEYDFGEVKLIIGEESTKAFLAVMVCPASGFRWAYLYRSSKMDIFIDSQVRFFEMIGGSFKEGVYDNMRNAVAKFVGRNEKELTQDLLKLSIYYGFSVNLTNAYSGNEKGTVESAVKWIRNKTFALKYQFESFEEAEEYLQIKLKEINRSSTIDEEIPHLSAYRPKYESARYLECSVNKYSLIQIDTNFYSVPEELCEKKVDVKLYPNDIVIMFKGEEVARHPRSFEKKKTCVDIQHYLHTLYRKPGALRNSLALKSNPDLNNIYKTYYKDKPKLFIELLRDNIDLPYEELMDTLIPDSNLNQENIHNNVANKTLEQIKLVNSLFIGGGGKYVN